MKAMLCTHYGAPEVLQLQELTTHTPKPNELLIKLHNTTVTSGDCRVRGLNVPRGFKPIMRLALGFNGPRQPILGSELAGMVEAIGAQVTQFKVGDAVFAFTDAKMGCYAEYICLPETAVVLPKPANLSFAEAAALSFGGSTALHFLTKAKLQRGDQVVINGASGCVGSAAVQLAKQLGAHVTAVCSTANVPMMQALGADQVIDYTQTDFTQQSQTYDFILDTTGKVTYANCKAVLKPKGRLALIAADLPEMLKSFWFNLSSKHQVLAGPAFGNLDALKELADLASQGQYHPVIDQSFPFTQLVEAHRYVDAGHKKGNVVIEFGI
jgi:NADPH:quinone reductase-like Zn-dependent oxidoreductase